MEELTQTTSSSMVPFGKYLLDHEIARGGMSRVWSARLRGLGGFEKRLVVKQVLPDLARDPRFVEMFVEEAKTLVQMSHPNIVPVYELGVVDGVYFLAMEHVEGATLAEMIKHGGTLAPSIVAQAGIQVCDALAYAHDRFEVVHRDVTPRNVIVDASGHARLLDFGIAAPAAGTGGTPGETFGSHGYMSPEQLRGAQLGPSSDLFSLGTVLFESLCGRPAYLKTTVEDTCEALLTGPRPSLADEPDVPADLRAIVDECLETDPARRPSSAKAMGRRLRGWLAANHPEGVASELGARAESARRARERPRPSEQPEDGTTKRRDPSGIVRTLATSRVLEHMLARADGDPNVDPVGDTARLREPGASSGNGTVPLERGARGSIEPPFAGTVSIRGDVTGPRTAMLTGRVRPPGRARLWITLGALVAVTGAVIGYRAISAQPPSNTTGGRSVTPTSPRDPRGAAIKKNGTPAPSVTPNGPVGSGQAPAQATGTPRAPVTPTAPGNVQPQAPVVPPAYIAVNAVPWAEVRLGRRLLGTTPLRRVAIPPGNHVLELSCPPLGRSQHYRVRAVSGQVTPVFVNLEQQ